MLLLPDARTWRHTNHCSESLAELPFCIMKLQRTGKMLAVAFTFCSLVFVQSAWSADQVQMKNGDRYGGTVLSLNADTLVVQSDVLGKVSLPRAQVSVITLNVPKMPTVLKSSTNAAPKSTSSTGTTDADLGVALRDLSTKTNLAQMQQELLSQAGPEASKKYYEMLGGLLTGKLTINDLRAEAKSVADQVRGIRADLGPEAGATIDGYLAILDNFLKESAPAPTNRAAK